MSIRRLMTLMLMVILGTMIMTIDVRASIPYRTFTEDSEGNRIPTHDAYLPAENIFRFESTTGFETLNQPEDVDYVAELDIHVIADTGNKRIVILDGDFKVKRTFTAPELERPTGIAANANHIYVADPDASSLFVFDHTGVLLETINRPESPLFGDDDTLFRPIKVKVDGTGNLYVVSEGSYNGILFFNPSFAFQNYFGSNSVIVTFRLIFENLFLTEAQRENRIIRNRPPSPNNVAVSDEGFVYTVTTGLSGNAIKRFNYVGDNKYPEDMSDQATYVSVAAGPFGNTIALTSEGVIDAFDNEGNLLFSFAGSGLQDSRLGLIGEGTAVLVKDDSTILVLDKKNNGFQRFVPTAFATAIHSAIALYMDGRYDEAREAWEDVLKVNQLFDLAHRGLGQAYFKQNEYDLAFEEFKLARDRSGYSMVYWELRNAVLVEQIPLIMSLVFLGIVASLIIKPLERKTGIIRRMAKPLRTLASHPFVHEWLFMFHFLRHPLDGFDDIKHRRGVSTRSTHVWVLLSVVLIILHIRFTGFLFNPYTISSSTASNTVMIALFGLAVLITANYLVSTLAEGEGRFSDIYIGAVHALSPLIIFMPILIGLSNVLTLNESFLYYFPVIVLVLWTLFYLYFMIKDIHNYQVGETFKNIFMTLFTAVILLIVGFILYNIFHQAYDFVTSVIREVVIRSET